jgi:hypothetical protein
MGFAVVTMRTRLTALFYRLRLALRAEGLDLRVADSRKQKLWGVGQYYVVSGKSVVNKDVNLETLVREMGLFESCETGGLSYRPEGRRALLHDRDRCGGKLPSRGRVRSRNDMDI